MASGTFIRLLIGIILLVLPGYYAYTIGIRFALFYLLDLILIPLLVYWEAECSCEYEDCILSSYCDRTKRYNFVKSIMKFMGYDSNKIDEIKIPTIHECGNDYLSMYSFIKKKYDKND